MTLTEPPEAAKAPEAAHVRGVEGRGKKDKHFIEQLLTTRVLEHILPLSFVLCPLSKAELCPEGFAVSRIKNVS
ncbi:MAG: hypothetical protein LBD24_00780 [Spirochaetaceae bacterium]|jgi:hypothetical protein|nr:hypothetical protein [Spirochaetaceae bacterium]